nr:retrovirus-related Pol polyprotein from transposon TNT 1-94 [Tanacetum cinerariifolium]
NRVLVTKPHNKTPSELLHGRTPSIGFMRPFDCLVNILNTLDPLGKFKGKVDEGFMVGYSVNRKAFRVFNSRTRIVQETLRVNFLENKLNFAGSGPTWLFDIDSLTRTMNYQPVTAGNHSNPSAGFQDEFDAEKAGEKVTQQYMLFPVWSSSSSNPQNKDGDAAFDGKEHEDDTKHIEIRHHFIRDCNKKKLIQVVKIPTKNNFADLLTKAFDVGRFQYLIARKGLSGVEMPLFEGMLVARDPEEQVGAKEQVQDNVDDATQGADTAVSGDDVQDQSIPSHTPHTHHPNNLKIFHPHPKKY